MHFTWYLASQNSRVLEWINKLNNVAVTLVKNHKVRRKHQVKNYILRHIPEVPFLLQQLLSPQLQ